MKVSLIGRKSILLSVALIVVSANALTSSAADDCELPNPTGSFVRDTSRFDEFRITLEAPDYANADAVRRHFVFSSIWGKALATEFTARSQGACDVQIDSGVFPDLRAFLVGYRSARGQNDFFEAVCVPLLREIVQSWTPDQAALERAIVDLTARRKWADALPLSARNYKYEFADEVLRSALARIYGEKSVMQALVSVDTGSYRTVAAGSLVEWIGQKRNGRLGVTSLSLCPSPSTSARLPLYKKKRTGVFPPSATAPEGAIALQRGKDLPTAFEHAVVIGDDRPTAAKLVLGYSMSPYARAVDQKYCNRKHVLDLGDGATSSVSIKCQFATLLQFDDWMLVFCDNCGSGKAAEAFAKLVTNDPELRAFKGAETDTRSRGPYLISFE